MFNSLSGLTHMVGAASIFWLLDPNHSHIKVKGRKAASASALSGRHFHWKMWNLCLVQAHYLIHFHRSRSIRNIPVSLPNLRCPGDLPEVAGSATPIPEFS